MALLAALLLWIALQAAPAASARAFTGPLRLTVDATRIGPVINSTQFGAFWEEINHSGDGGLYAELVRNRDLKENRNAPLYWSSYTSKGSRATIHLDAKQSLNRANPVSLRLSIGDIAPGGTAGIANSGYWGIPVRPSTTYQVSFFAKSSRPMSGVLTVALAGAVRAATTISGVTDHWAKYTTTITTPRSIPTSLNNRFVITTADPADSGSTIWFEMVSLFPPTYDSLANGLRVDLMQKIAALHPGYFRIPGGNYLEGDTIATRFEWKHTIGAIEDRPGHQDTAWDYWSQDGLGLLESLELAEEVDAQPLLAAYAGYSLHHMVVPRRRLRTYVQDALDEIQYAIGPTSTRWGARRAADGHPAPFDVKLIELGNEDFFDSSGTYNAYRYPMFYDAIKAAFPQLKIVATAHVSSRPVDVLDEHFYDSPSYFAAHAHVFDRVSGRGPKILIGEYAATQGRPTGTLAGALGEAVFLTGTERNANLVIGASYAPLLVNVNDPHSPPDLIGYDGLHSYVSPSYWVLTMLANGHGERVIGSRLDGGSGNLVDVASHSRGHTYVVVVNSSRAAEPTVVKLNGLDGGAEGGTATVLSGGPSAMNSLAHPNAVAPRVHNLPALGTAFSYTFPAHSVTVLDLRTA